MKRFLGVAVSLFAALPLCVAAAGPAPALQVPAASARVHSVKPDYIWGGWYLSNYNDYLTDPYGQGNGTPVKFDYNVIDPTSYWDIIEAGTVTSSTFGNNQQLCETYCGDWLVGLENSANKAYELGTTEDEAVMRPTADGNLFVEHPLANLNYQFVSVYATNNWGGGEIAYCLTNDGAGNQAMYAPCGSPGQTISAP
jgi:hypothetical protein